MSGASLCRALVSSLLLLAAGAGGCATTPTGEAKPASAAPVTELSRYLPLEDDSVFSYETYIEDTNERGLAVFEIKRPRPGLAELSIAGQVRKRYYIEPNGVRSSHGGYLLKAPLRLDSQWTGDDGQVSVAAMGETLDVPAGKFAGCIRTVEQARLGAATRKTTTVFCPGVGISLLEIEAEQEGTSVLQRLRLKSFGPRFKGL